MDMKSISQKLQDDIRAVMEANLHPNQQKIDVHEPEKDEITAHDFKKLRAMKKDSNGKITKEEAEMVNELSKKTLGSYIKKNVGDQRDLSYQHGEDPEEYESDSDSVRKATNRETGLNKAVKRLTKEDTDEQIQELAGKAAQQAAIAISLIKAGKKDGKMPKPMKEDSVQEEEKKKPVSPFDYKNYQSQIPKKPGETAGFDSKKISTGTVYTRKPVKEDADLDEAKSESKKDMMARQQRLAAAGTETAKDPARMKKMSSIPGYSAAMDLAKKSVKEAMSDQAKTTMKHIPNASPALKKAAKDIKPGVAGYRDRIDMLKAGGVKEEVEQEEYTFADYLEAARAKYVDEDAVLVANEAFKNKDITLFSDQSQSPEA